MDVLRRLHGSLAGRLRRLLWSEMPDRQAALRKYRAHAGSYTNRFLLRTQEGRRKNIARLGLTKGRVVMDVGCGTGLSFPILQECIGPGGMIFGIEQSPEMLREAELQVNRFGWLNVVLIQAPAEEAIIAVEADAAVFYATHDIMRTPRALQNVMTHLKLGAGVLAVGMMWAPWWAVATNLRTWNMARQFCTTLEGMQKPWSYLESLVSELKVEQGIFHGFGAYIAIGRK
jgi:precorrin-6B methylase 2